MKKIVISLIAVGVIAVSSFVVRLQSTKAGEATNVDTRVVSNQPGAFVIDNFIFQPSREGYVEIVFDAVNNTEKDVHYFEISAQRKGGAVTLGFYRAEAKPFNRKSKLQIHRTVTKDYVTAENLTVRLIVFTDGTFVGENKRGQAILAERDATNQVAQKYAQQVQSFSAISADFRLKAIQALREQVMTEARQYPRRQAPAVRNDDEYVALASEQATLDALLDLATRLEHLEKDFMKGNPDQSRLIDETVKRIRRYM